MDLKTPISFDLQKYAKQHHNFKFSCGEMFPNRLKTL